MSGLIFTLTGDDNESEISVYIPGVGFKSAFSDHANFNAIVEAARAGDESVADLFDVGTALIQRFASLSDGGRVSYADGRLFLDNDEIHGVVVDHILASMSAGLRDFTPLVNFIEKLAANPNQGSVDQLYAWLVREGFTIDTDGYLVAYKGVQPNGNGGFSSINTGRAIVNGDVKTGAIPQNIGDVVEMPRSEVQYDPSNGCSTGLHVGNFDYANGWARGALLEVRVDPADVVSVPTDCSAQKMRVCRYTIVGTIEQKITAPVIGSEYDEPDFYDSVWGDGEYDDEDSFWIDW